MLKNLRLKLRRELLKFLVFDQHVADMDRLAHWTLATVLDEDVVEDTPLPRW